MTSRQPNQAKPLKKRTFRDVHPVITNAGETAECSPTATNRTIVIHRFPNVRTTHVHFGKARH